MLLSTCGRAVYQLLSDLLSPIKPADTEYKKICETLREHFNPTPPEIVLRHRFYSRSRRSGETIAGFLAELRRLARDCNFGASLNSMLRDRLVLGIADDSIQRRLLSEKDLTLEKALSLAQAHASATEGSQAVAKAMAGEAVQVVRQSAPSRRCFRCLSQRHLAAKCPFLNKKCFKCGKEGHTAAACKSAVSNRREGQAVQEVEAEPEELHSLHALAERRGKVPPIETTITIEDKPVRMEIDTGASVSLISSRTYEAKLSGRPRLEAAHTQLRTYSGEAVPVLGRIMVRVQADKTAKILPLLVVKGAGSDLIGRDWLLDLPLDWRSINQVQTDEHPGIRRLLEKYASVFEPGLGQYTGPPVQLRLKPDARPRFFKARSVPFALRSKVEAQLDKEIEQGVLKPVSSSDYASPIVPVLKADGSVRICADFKQTVNLDVEPDKYPLPRIEELFAKLAGGSKFTKLDLSQAYSQIPLDESSQQICTVNTSKGLLRYARLPFGIAPAVGIFQRHMDNLLQGIPGVAGFLDDLLVTGADDESHLQSLELVLRRLQDSGLRCGMSKCDFMQDRVCYLGHRIDSAGLHPLPEKIRAIVDAPQPQDVSQLRSFLGLVNYYGKFLPNLSTELAPLHHLLNQGVEWCWKATQDAAFQNCKDLLSKAPVLAHFDVNKPLVLECDASPYGLGAAICHRVDGMDWPIAFASRSLHDAETKYSQLEKEALAIVFGIKKFHAYLYGRQFTLISDHKPLLGLLHESKPIPAMASSRIQRWALLLSAYSYTMEHRAGSSVLRADALSRLPLPEKPKGAPALAEVVLVMDMLDEGPVTAENIRAWTRTDPVLAKVVHFLETGCWPTRLPSELQPYGSRAEQLSVESGCVLWGGRVVVPLAGRAALLQCLHQGHPGSSRMKAMARSYFWWPGLDDAIEQLVSACSDCRELQSSPAPVPLRPWAWPDQPWSRLHIDFAGPIEGKMLLVIVDAHSKWMDVHVMTTTSSAATIQRLRQSFATHGLPDIVVTDNGPNLVSEEMTNFLQKNGIRHIRTAPYHPASNGQAERAVQTLKRSLAKQKNYPIEDRVARFLLSYRVTPHATTGVPPCELLMGRRLRSLLDRVRPDVKGRVLRQQERQRQQHDIHARDRQMQVGDAVLARDYASDGRWKPATVTGSSGAVSFECQFKDGRGAQRHIDQLRKPSTSATTLSVLPEPQPLGPVLEAANKDGTEIDSRGEPRRSGRIRTQPDRLQYE